MLGFGVGSLSHRILCSWGSFCASLLGLQGSLGADFVVKFSGGPLAPQDSQVGVSLEDSQQALSNNLTARNENLSNFGDLLLLLLVR